MVRSLRQALPFSPDVRSDILSTPDVHLSTPGAPSRNGHRKVKTRKGEQRPNAEQRRERFEAASQSGRLLMAAIADMLVVGHFSAVADSFKVPDMREDLAAFLAAELSEITGMQVPAYQPPGVMQVTGEDVVRLLHDLFDALASRAAE